MNIKKEMSKLPLCVVTVFSIHKQDISRYRLNSYGIGVELFQHGCIINRLKLDKLSI